MDIMNFFRSRATKLQNAKTAAMQEQGFYKAVNLWDAYVSRLKDQEKTDAVAEIQEDLAAKLYDSRAQLSTYASASNLSELVSAEALASVVVRKIASTLDEAIAPYCDTTLIINGNSKGKQYRERKEIDAIQGAVLKGGITSTVELLEEDEQIFMREVSYARTLLLHADSEAHKELTDVVSKYTCVASQMVVEIVQSILTGIQLFKGRHRKEFNFLYESPVVAYYGWCLLQLRDDVNKKYDRELAPVHGHFQRKGFEISQEARSQVALMNQIVTGYLNQTTPQAQEAIQYWIEGYCQDTSVGKLVRAMNITQVCNVYELQMPANISRVENIGR